MEALAEVISVPSEAKLGSVDRSYKKTFLLIVRKECATIKDVQWWSGLSVWGKPAVTYWTDPTHQLCSVKWRLESHNLRSGLCSCIGWLVHRGTWQRGQLRQKSSQCCSSYIMHPGIGHSEEEVPFYNSPKGTPGVADAETFPHQVSDQMRKC